MSGRLASSGGVLSDSLSQPRPTTDCEGRQQLKGSPAGDSPRDKSERVSRTDL